MTRKLGEANLLYSTGKFPDAIQLLKDVIRINPMMPDAYHTMALVYEALDDPKKAFNFSLLAAHLTPKVSVSRRRPRGHAPCPFAAVRNSVRCLLPALLQR